MKTGGKVGIKWMLYWRKIILLAGIVFCNAISYAQNYTISRFDYTWCTAVYPTAYQTGSFSITETSITGQNGLTKNQTNKSFRIDLPAGFEFNTTAAADAITATGTEVTIVSWLYNSVTEVQVNITTVNAQAEYNTINFDNFEIRATAAGSGIMYRASGLFKVDNSTGIPATTVSFGNLTAGTPFSYTGSTVEQPNTGNVSQYTINNDIIRVKITGAGSCVATVTSFNFNTDGNNGTGTDIPATNITTAKVFYTGSSTTFATTTYFGSAASPNGAFTISGSQSLADGDNYFWLTYDVPGEANTDAVTPLNRLDAQLESFVLDAVTKSDMATSNPAGSRPIIGASFYYSRATGNWNDNTNWSITDNGGSCSCQPNGSGVAVIDTNHTITIDANRSVDVVAIYKDAVLTGASALTVNSSLNTFSTGYFSLSQNLTVAGNVTLSGSGSSSNSKIIDIGGDLNVGVNTTLTASGGGAGNGEAIYIGGNLTVNGTLQQTGNKDILMDGGYFSISGTGSIAAGRDFIVQNGNKSIAAGTVITIAPDFNIEGAYTVTNSGTVTLQGDLDGNNASSQWTNAASSYLYYGGAAEPFSTSGELEALANSNTIEYNRAGNQTAALPNSGGIYSYLIFSGSGIKSLAGSIVVEGNLTLNGTAQLDVTAANNAISLEGNWTDNSGNATPFNGRAGTVTLNGSVAQTIGGTSSTTFYNLTADNSNNINQGVANTVSNTLTLTNGSVILGNYDLFIGTASSTTAGISGYSSLKYIVTDGTGYLKQYNIGSGGRTGSIVFPVGISTASYTPATIDNTGTADRFDIKVCNNVRDNGACSGGTQYLNYAVDRTWSIAEAAGGGSTVDLTLQWNASDELPLFNRALSYVGWYNGSGWSNTQAAGAAAGGDPYTRTTTAIAAFTPEGFGVGSDGVLPIELLSFNAHPVKAAVLLDWTTASEINNDYFTLERTRDGTTFEVIGKVKGAGNSNKELSYSYIDDNPYSGTSYYRLTQTDFDGKFSRTRLVPVTISLNSQEVVLRVFPNPSNGENIMINLEGVQGSEVLVVVTDMLGNETFSKVVLSENGSVLTAIDPSNKLAAGIYLVVASSANELYKQKLVIR